MDCARSGLTGSRVFRRCHGVAVVGIGSRFTDARMGVTGDVMPDERLRSVYDVVYSLLRWLVEGTPHTP